LVVSNTESKMPDQPFLINDMITVHSGDAVPDVAEYVDDVVGGDASRQLGRFTHSVSENAEGDTSILEFSVENFPNGSSHGYGLDRGHMARSFDVIHTSSENDDDGLAMGASAAILAQSADTKPDNPSLTFTSDDGPQQMESILEFSVENFPNHHGQSLGDEGPSAGMDDMGSSFDLVFPTQTALSQRGSNAVATESLEIAHEGLLGDHDDGWCMAVEIDSPESVRALYDLVV
jgi:hypothetical protein